MNKGRKLYLLTRIEAEAKLLTGLGKVAEALGDYPHFRRSGSRSKLSYFIDDNELLDRSYSVEFRSNAIIIELHSIQSPLYFMNEMLIRLLSIAGFLEECYEIRFASLAPYFIEALSTQRLAEQLEGLGMSKHEHNGDIVLARRIVSLTRELSAMSKKYNAKALESDRLLQRYILANHARDASVATIQKTLDIDAGRVTDALAQLADLGYKVVYTSRERFDVITHES